MVYFNLKKLNVKRVFTYSFISGNLDFLLEIQTLFLNINKADLLFFSYSLVLIGIWGFIFNKNSIIHLMLCIELILLGSYLSFIYINARHLCWL